METCARSLKRRIQSNMSDILVVMLEEVLNEECLTKYLSALEIMGTRS